MVHQTKHVLWGFTIVFFPVVPRFQLYRGQFPWGSLGYRIAPFSELFYVCWRVFKISPRTTGRWYLTFLSPSFQLLIYDHSRSLRQGPVSMTNFSPLLSRKVHLQLVRLLFILLALPHDIIGTFRQASSEMTVNIQL